MIDGLMGGKSEAIAFVKRCDRLIIRQLAATSIQLLACSVESISEDKIAAIIAGF
ncbi:MAG TPA: hypothetical protein VK211_11480 [Kamptonema sp.]|nr:hypothetical protein [Kamptonema sp.]